MKPTQAGTSASFPRLDGLHVPTLPTLRDPHALLAGLRDAERLRRGLEVAIVVLLAVQAARLAWLLLPPAALGTLPTEAASAARPDPGRLAIDAFHPVRGPATAADTSGLQLFAVRPAAGGGSAILAMRDGAQRSYAAGDEVAPGVRLAAVASDHVVVLDGGGRRSELRFAQPDHAAPRRPATQAAPPPAGATPTSTAPAASAPATAPAIDPAALMADMGLIPEQTDGRVTGYTVVPRGNGAALRASGLQAGDVLVSVNNEALDPERYAALAETLGGASTITLTYRRDGQIRSATLQAQTP